MKKEKNQLTCSFLIFNTLYFCICIFQIIHERNDFAEVSKNFDVDLKIIILLDYQLYLCSSSIMNNVAKYFDILASSLSVLHILMIQPNYF